MKTPYISMVVPVYNAEKYLSKMIESVLEQSFSDWELILVENASKDKSLEVCETYAAQDERIHVIHKEENVGANGARSLGVASATGRYLTFMDSDDYIDSDLFEDAYVVLQKMPAKLLVAGAFEEYYNEEGGIETTIPVLPIDEQENTPVYADADETRPGMKVLFLDGQDAVRRRIMDLENRTLYGYLWNKFYDLAYLRQSGVTFHQQTLLEDARFNVDYAMDIDSMILINVAGYHYCKRKETSLTSKVITDYYEIHRDHVERLLQQQKYWGLDDTACRRTLGDIYVRYIASALERNCRPDAGLTSQDRKQWLQNLFSDPLCEELLSYAEGQGTLGKMLCKPIQKKSAWQCLTLGRMLYILRWKFSWLFAKLRRKK